MESFILDWILPFVKPYLDPMNFGGLNNVSSAHYLLKLLEFIHKHLNDRKPKAVTVMFADLEKAFNKVMCQKL